MDLYTHEKMMNFKQHEINVQFEQAARATAAKSEEITVEARPKTKSFLSSLLVALRLKPAQ